MMNNDGKRSMVSVRKAKISIPTYEPQAPTRNPMFLERRVYQGSGGHVYPIPSVERFASEKTDHLWDAIYLENEFVEVLILPELGGRIHAAKDKTNGYDFIYRNNVIKPALIGLPEHGSAAALNSIGRSIIDPRRSCRRMSK